MKIYEYKNYEEYLDNQIEANVKKLKNIYVEKKTIRKICEDKTMRQSNSILKKVFLTQKL
jgi:hypothetical protein